MSADNNIVGQVWVVIRDIGPGYWEGPEVDVFTNEAAAREHASRIDQDDVIVREEAVAATAWAETD